MLLWRAFWQCEQRCLLPHTQSSASLSVLLFQSLELPMTFILCCVWSFVTQWVPLAPSPLVNAHSPLNLVEGNQSINLIFQGVSQLRITRKLPRLSLPRSLSEMLKHKPYTARYTVWKWFLLNVGMKMLISQDQIRTET